MMMNSRRNPKPNNSKREKRSKKIKRRKKMGKRMIDPYNYIIDILSI